MIRSTEKVVRLPRRHDSRKETLDRLFNEEGRILRGYLFKRLRDTSEVDDVVQEVFLKLARLPDLEGRLPANGKNRNFLIAVANNLIVDRERKRATRRQYRAAEKHRVTGIISYEITPEVEVAACEDLRLVKDSIMKLKPNWQRAFVLSRFGYMTYRQISAEMDVSVKQVEKYITNALIQLRKSVNPDPVKVGRGKGR